MAESVVELICSLGSDGRTGLVNSGQNCYVNTFVQCMAHTDPLSAKLDVINFKAKGTEDTPEKRKQLAVCHLGYTFHILVLQMWSGKYSRLWPEPLKRAFKGYQDTHPGSAAANQNFAGTAQQDIEELITMMLDVLDETYSRVRSAIPLAEPPPNQWEARITYQRQTHQSIIQDLFIFLVTERFVCHKCQQSKHGAFEPKGVLIVNLPSGMKKVSLIQCLDSVFAESTAESVICRHCREAYKTAKNWTKEDYNEYKTEGKKDPKKIYKNPWKHDMTTKTVLLDLPPILIIQLKRFVNDPIKGTTRKNVIEVDFPFKGLDMRPYLNPEQPEDKQRKYIGSTLYDLYAVANQMGALAGGHYNAYAKPSHDFHGIGWRQFNDCHISDIDENFIKKKNSAYILFYRRRDTSKDSRKSTRTEERVQQEDTRQSKETTV